MLKNKCIAAGWKPNRRKLVYIRLSGQHCWIPCKEIPGTEELKVRLTLAYQVPQQIIVLEGENFSIRTPEIEPLDTREPACRICGVTLFSRATDFRSAAGSRPYYVEDVRPVNVAQSMVCKMSIRRKQSLSVSDDSFFPRRRTAATAGRQRWRKKRDARSPLQYLQCSAC